MSRPDLRAHRHSATDCERRIQCGQADVDWQREPILAFQAMKALALPFELHPAWQESWYP